MPLSERINEFEKAHKEDIKKSKSVIRTISCCCLVIDVILTVYAFFVIGVNWLTMFKLIWIMCALELVLICDIFVEYFESDLFRRRGVLNDNSGSV